MAQVTFASIQPLISKQEVARGTATCTFTCPETGVSADASAPIPRAEDFKGRALDKVKGGLMLSLRRQLQRTVYSVLGRSMGRIASDLLGEGLEAAADKVQHSQEQVEEAVTTAFQQVQEQFHWDSARQRWVGGAAAAAAPAAASAPAGPSFMERLQRAPVSEPGDRQLLVRLLVGVAKSDGDVSAEEQQFLGGFMGVPPETMATLAQQEAPAERELQEASPGEVRHTMVLLLWALAMCDEQLHLGEQARVRGWASSLELDEQQANVLRDCAADHLVQAALMHVYRDGAADEGERAEMVALAQRLEVSGERLTALDAQVRAQLGLA